MKDKLDFLEMYLSLFIEPDQLINDKNEIISKYIILDVRNEPYFVKRNQIKGAITLPEKDLFQHLSYLEKEKIYVIYGWTIGAKIEKRALLTLLSSGFEAFELSGGLERWELKGLPIEKIS